MRKAIGVIVSPSNMTVWVDGWAVVGWAVIVVGISANTNIIGKKNTQRIERKNLTLRTRIKRLCRKTICYSKCQVMHDIVIGLVINILEFGVGVGRLVNRFGT